MIPNMRLLPSKVPVEKLCSARSLLCACFLFACLRLVQGDAADSVVVFNELQYQPVDETAQSEWIELRNMMGVTVDLSGWYLDGGVRLTFDEGTRIKGGDYLVVSTKPTDSLLLGSRVYPKPLLNRLANEGETILLKNRNGRVMDELNYASDGDWPVGARGSGATLAKRNEDSAEGDLENWVSSSQIGGTPGRRNFPRDDAPPVVSELVGRDALWRYLNSGVSAPSDWNEPDFDGSSWNSAVGPFHRAYDHSTEQSSGLFGYWKLDERSGRIAYDEVTGLEGLLVNGVNWIDDETRGTVLEFDGEDGFVRTGAFIPPLSLESDFTWAFWSFSRRPANVNVIVGNRYQASGADFSPREFVKFTNAALEFHRLGSGEDISYPAIPRNEWVHHAAVKSGSTLRYYRDGVLLGTQNLSAGLANAQPFYFGGDQSRENWRGRLDEVGLWSVALSEESVLGLAKGTFSPISAPTDGTQPELEGHEFQDVGSTIYFLTEFVFSGKPSQTQLSMELRVDDGAVVYLNGQEVHRANVGNGPVSFETGALLPVDLAEWSRPISLDSGALVSGRNVIAVEVHQVSNLNDAEDFVFELSLGSSELLQSDVNGAQIIFNELSEGGGREFSLELLNRGDAPVALTPLEIRSSESWRLTFAPGEVLQAGELVVLTEEDLEHIPEPGERLFLLAESGQRLLDSVTVSDQLEARIGGRSNRWIRPARATFGQDNKVADRPTIVINELMYHPRERSPIESSAGQWIELLNWGAESVDLSGWRFDDGVQFVFPPDTILGPGQYFLLVGDARAFRDVYSEIPVVGEWGGSLSKRGEQITLVDVLGNSIDEVRYFDDGRWPANADGDGSSLELRDPRGDSRSAEAWAASHGEGPWQTIAYGGLAKNGVNDPTRYHEFIVGLLEAGELLIDDISVVEVRAGVRRELIQNGSFENGNADSWRFLGNHSRADVIPDPTLPGNTVLKLTATGPTEHMSNHAETTLRFGNAYVSLAENREYEITFRAKWLSGSNQLNTRLYFNRLPKTTLLNTGNAGGSPGEQNTTWVENLGPSLDGLSHAPVVPAEGEAMVVRVEATDPDGVAGLFLNYAARGRSFSQVPMDLVGGQWRGTIPGQRRGTNIQFFIEATDGRGKVSWFPAEGPDSSALIPVADGQADLDYGDCQPMNLRIVMKEPDIGLLHESTNVMSNDRLGCTVIVDERLAYYDAGVRLKGSEHGRASDVRVGYNIRFPADDLFLGAHETIAVDRSGAGDQFSQREIMIKHAINHAGGIPGSYDDLIRVIAPRSQYTGSAILSKARFDREFLVNQYGNGESGPIYEYELIYVLTGTNGGVEGLKVTQSGEVRGVPPRTLGGSDKELYRWHWQLKNKRSADDFSPIINMVSALGESGSRYRIETERLLDVDQWLRAFAVQVLFGVADNYSSGASHNAMFYQRPVDGKMLYFPWDMDFTFIRGSSSSLVPNDDQKRLIRASARNERQYYRHLLEIIQTTFNGEYLSEWATHYSCFLPSENLNRFLPYVRSRRSFALAEIQRAVPEVAFSISTDDNFSTPSTAVDIEGKGWLDIDELRLAGGEGLPIEWISLDTWRVSVPIRPGTNAISINAIDRFGSVIASDVVNVVGTGRVQPASADNLAVTEIMYHPGDPSAEEQAAGWFDAEAFEYIEIFNLSDEFSVDLGGLRFTDGIRYDFDTTLVRPGGRVLLVGNLGAFQRRYGRDLPVVGAFHSPDGNRLSNSGERLSLFDAIGTEIVSIEWSDRSPWPESADGGGYSLVPLSLVSSEQSLPSRWRSSVLVGGNPAVTDTLTLDDWRSDYGIDILEDDLDGDGWASIVEYLAGSDPRSSADVPGIEVALEEGQGGERFLIVRVEVGLGRDDVLIIPRHSTDLVEWINQVSYVGQRNEGNGRATLQFRSEMPVSEEERQFIRLDVVVPERVGD